MLRLSEPDWQTLRASRGEDPAVRVRFAPVTPGMKRRAKHAAGKALGDADIKAMDVLELADIGDVFSRELLRLAIVEWDGVGDADGNPVEITPPLDERLKTSDKADRPTGTIDLFLAHDEMFEAADRLYVMPIVDRDREKNASAASPSGTGEAATRAKTIARSAAARKPKAGAKHAPTAQTSRKRPRGKKSGS